jgi:hypothetical protein
VFSLFPELIKFLVKTVPCLQQVLYFQNLRSDVADFKLGASYLFIELSLDGLAVGIGLRAVAGRVEGD